MSDTRIEWADRVWNPTTGCDRVSGGCDHCYALAMAKRLKAMGSAKYQRDGDPQTSGPGFGLNIHPDTLAMPLQWRKPQRIFVNSMSDLFHDQVPDDFICQVFGVMYRANHHTFQLLTKRHARMRSLLNSGEFWAGVSHYGGRYLVDNPVLPNVWLGVSIENQQWADIRIPALLTTPAAVRFVSAEPLLGPVDLYHSHCPVHDSAGGMCTFSCPNRRRPDWVITGGESGHGSRPAHPDWFRAIRDQCKTADIAYLHKQHGDWVPESMWLHGGREPAGFSSSDGRFRPLVGGWPTEPPYSRGSDITIRRVGKKAAGRKLDGRIWDELPGTVVQQWPT